MHQAKSMLVLECCTHAGRHFPSSGWMRPNWRPLCGIVRFDWRHSLIFFAIGTGLALRHSILEVILCGKQFNRPQWR
jgi:hypothetical protein